VFKSLTRATSFDNTPLLSQVCHAKLMSTIKGLSEIQHADIHLSQAPSQTQCKPNRASTQLLSGLKPDCCFILKNLGQTCALHNTIGLACYALQCNGPVLLHKELSPFFAMGIRMSCTKSIGTVCVRPMHCRLDSITICQHHCQDVAHPRRLVVLHAHCNLFSLAY